MAWWEWLIVIFVCVFVVLPMIIGLLLPLLGGVVGSIGGALFCIFDDWSLTTRWWKKPLKVLAAIAWIAILPACLGVFGLGFWATLGLLVFLPVAGTFLLISSS